MTHRHLLRRCHLASIAVGTIASAILFSASIAQPQAAKTNAAVDLAGNPTALVHRVADSTHNAGPGGFADLAEKIGPAVIGVTSKGTAQSALPGRPGPDVPGQAPLKQRIPGLGAGKIPGLGAGKAPDEIQTVSIGSGFFISPDGYAVTNSHVVEDNDAAEIRTSDNKTYQARVVGKDSLSDLALIKVEGRTDFSYVKFADRPPRIGDWILTGGNPFGLGGTITAGIVSASRREIATGPDEGFLQIDAPINRGDSGGPSFNADGEVVGVNTMILSPSGGSSGVALAVPADTAKSVIPQLKDKGTVRRGYLGAEIQSVTPDISESLGSNDLHGAIVASIRADGPGAGAGLRRGDVITSAGGEPIKSANELTRKVHATAPGSSIQLAIVRGGKASSLDVTLGQLPDQPKLPHVSPE